LCRAAILLLAAELGLRLLPFGTLLEWAERRGETGTVNSSLSAERIAWLVEAAARNGALRGQLRPTCLRQSLVLCALLRERGLPARLAIGTNVPQEGFQAHSWVVLNGKVLGAQTAAGYQELIAVDPPISRVKIA
jgi:hypothetical protein